MQKDKAAGFEVRENKLEILFWKEVNQVHVSCVEGDDNSQCHADAKELVNLMAGRNNPVCLVIMPISSTPPVPSVCRRIVLKLTEAIEKVK